MNTVLSSVFWVDVCFVAFALLCFVFNWYGMRLIDTLKDHWLVLVIACLAFFGTLSEGLFEMILFGVLAFSVAVIRAITEEHGRALESHLDTIAFFLAGTLFGIGGRCLEIHNMTAGYVLGGTGLVISVLAFYARSRLKKSRSRLERTTAWQSHSAGGGLELY